MKKKSEGGIYAIYNKIVKSVYIGRTNNFCIRWKTHKTLLNSNWHKNYPLQRDWNSQGKDSFSFEILEICDIEKSVEREAYWIEKMKKDGYFTYNLMGRYSFFGVYRVANLSLIAPLVGKDSIFCGRWEKAK